jgi:methylamine dehydrogenase heavy chain
MRLKGLLLGATALAATLAPLVPATAQEIKPETVTVEKLAPDMKRVYLVALTINHVADGKVWVVDGDKMELKGMVELGFLGLFYHPPKSDKMYVATTFYDRLTRGNRADVVTVFDANTLAVVDEFPIPMKRIMPIQYRPYFTGSADGKTLFIQNSTPATSITVTDIGSKKSFELDAPGCIGTYPSVGDSSRVSTMCGDGTIGTYTLKDGGGSRKASEKLFDADKDAWFIHGEKHDGNYMFVSFLGNLNTVNLDGEVAKKVESFSIVDGIEGGWRPSGYMPFAVDGGRAFVLMHSNGAEGSHKNPSEEIWTVDLKSKKVVSRAKSPAFISLTVKGGTLYGINPLEPSIVKMTVGADGALADAGSLKVGETATQIEASN